MLLRARLHLHLRRSLPAAIAALVLGCGASAQQTPVPYTGAAPPTPALTAISPGLFRLEGEDPGSGIHYVRILLLGTGAAQPPREPTPSATSTPGLSRPTLTGQCTRDRNGKLHFELFANFGGVPDPAFYPPWQPTPGDLFPPVNPRVMLTMDFLGYTRVKPFKRQFEQVEAPGAAQLRYLNPGHGSSNLEPPAWFFQYLRALPTLRLSDATHAAEFPTGAWLAQLHNEPLCAASGA